MCQIMLYVNPTTIKLCKSAYKKLNEAKKCRQVTKQYKSVGFAIQAYELYKKHFGWYHYAKRSKIGKDTISSVSLFTLDGEWRIALAINDGDCYVQAKTLFGCDLESEVIL